MATPPDMDVDEMEIKEEQADFSSPKTNENDDKDKDENNKCPDNDDDFKRPIFRAPKPEQPAAPSSHSTSSSSTTTKKDRHADTKHEDNTSDKKGDDGSDHGRSSRSNYGYCKSSSSLSPAEQAKQMRSTIPYKEPSWGGLAPRPYSFDVLKNGSIIDNVDLTDKSFYIFGRLPTCDYTLEHPSLSRYHACIQNCTEATERYQTGWYLYDLDSTHGTWINKVRVIPKVYHRIRVGHVIKFGGSTRLFILQGPDDDQEEESELSIAELKMQREKHKRETDLLRQEEPEEDPNEVVTRDDGCMWGMDMVNVTDDNQENPFALGMELDESFYIDDPKKALKNYLDREGFDAPEYETHNECPGRFRCSIELPIDDANGRPIVAVVSVTGKKREAVEACALEACRILDRQGVLRAATHESRKRKKKNWEENDFYDSDEDTFLDRTGTIEKKREQRMKKAGKLDDKTENYESLSEKHTVVVKEIQEIEEKLEKAKADAAALESSEDMDALDAYMNSIKSGVMDTKNRMKLKRRLLELRPQEQHLRKLVNLTRPASLPQLKPFIYQPKTESGTTSAKPKALPIFGKMKGGNLPKAPKVFTVSMPPSIDDKNEPEEEEEEEEEDEEDAEEKETQRQTVLVTNNKDARDPRTQTSPKDTVTPPHANDQRSPVESDESPNGKTSDSEKKTERVPTSRQSGDIFRYSSTKKTPATPSSDPNPSTKKQKPISHMSASLAFSSGMFRKEQKKSKEDAANFDDDPEKVVWLPPTNQSGDGRTSLNDKFGY